MLKRKMSGKNNTPLTFEERQYIEAHIKVGLSSSKISKQLKRGKNTVVVEVRKNGGRKLYTALVAQQNTERRRIEGYEKVRTYNLGRKNPVSCSQRIEFLEMQMEILSESVKEILKK